MARRIGRRVVEHFYNPRDPGGELTYEKEYNDTYQRHGDFVFLFLPHTASAEFSLGKSVPLLSTDMYSVNQKRVKHN